MKRRGDDRKFLARVLSIGVDCDVALLDVEDAGFWEDVTPLAFGTLPRLQVLSIDGLMPVSCSPLHVCEVRVAGAHEARSTGCLLFRAHRHTAECTARC